MRHQSFNLPPSKTANLFSLALYLTKIIQRSKETFFWLRNACLIGSLPPAALTVCKYITSSYSDRKPGTLLTFSTKIISFNIHNNTIPHVSETGSEMLSNLSKVTQWGLETRTLSLPVYVLLPTHQYCPGKDNTAQVEKRARTPFSENLRGWDFLSFSQAWH